MTFGEWLRGRRLQHGLTLRVLADQVGLDMGTLSRIENDRTQPTLMTVMRVSDYFEVTIAELLQALDVTAQSDPGAEPLTADDPHFPITVVLSFLDLFYANPARGKALLVKMLNQVSQQQASRAEATTEDPFSFDTSHVDLLLGSSPVVWARMNPPTRLTSEQIRAMARRGDVLTPTDVVIFTQQLLAEQLRQVDRQGIALFRRLATSSLAGVKFSDVVEADRDVVAGGGVAEVYWAAARTFQRITHHGGRVPRRRNQLNEVVHAPFRVASLFIDMYRWLEFLQGNTSTWREDVCQAMSEDAAR